MVIGLDKEMVLDWPVEETHTAEYLYPSIFPQLYLKKKESNMHIHRQTHTTEGIWYPYYRTKRRGFSPPWWLCPKTTSTLDPSTPPGTDTHIYTQAQLSPAQCTAHNVIKSLSISLRSLWESCWDLMLDQLSSLCWYHPPCVQSIPV